VFTIVLLPQNAFSCLSSSNSQTAEAYLTSFVVSWCSSERLYSYSQSICIKEKTFH